MNSIAGRQPQGSEVEMQPVGLPSQPARRDSARSGSFSIKSRAGFSRFLRNQGRKTAAYVKEHDLYGQPVSLNYKGEDSFKTVPGGVISLVIKIVFVLYSILKFKYMMVRQEWELTRQEKVATDLDLGVVHELGDKKKYEHISLAVQFQRKSARLKGPEKIEMNPWAFHDEHFIKMVDPSYVSSEEQEELEEEYASSDTRNDIILMSKYLRFFGMIQKRQGSDFEPYDTDINEDSYDWKEYKPTWDWNKGGMYQMNVDLEDAVLQGTENDSPDITEVISKYQLRFDTNRMRYEAFQACLKNPGCGPDLAFTNQEIKSKLIAQVKETYEYEDQDAMIKYIDYFEGLSKSNRYKDIAALRDYFFIEYQASVIQKAKIDRIFSADSEYYRKKFNERYDDFYRNPSQVLLEMDEEYVKYVNGQGGRSFLTDEDQLKAWDDAEESIDNANAIRQQYISQDKKFREEIDFKIAKYNIQLIVKDEIESFKKHDDAGFDYPFQVRKNKVASFTMDMKPFNETYTYPSEFLKFRQSFVCLEPSIFRQMLFFTDLVEEGINVITGKKEKDGIEDQLEEFCDSTLFKKIKLQESKSTWKDYQDDYEPEVIEEKILLEVILGLDAFKTETVRFSSQILDFLGDIGGFYGALDLMVFVFGGYFSAKLFAASIAKTLYIQSRRKKDIARDEAAEKEEEERGASNFILEKIFSEDGDEKGADTARPMMLKRQDTKTTKDTLQTRMKRIKNQFSHIEFSSYRVVLDPILSSFFCCFKEEKLVKFPIFKRQKVLAKCENKLNDELEITTLLTRVRESYDMLQNLQTDQQKELLKYSKDRVIDLHDSNSSSSEEEEEEVEGLPADDQVPPLTKVDIPPSSECSSDAIQFPLPEDIRRAYDFSIVRGLALDVGERVGLMEKMGILEEEAKSKEAESAKDLSESYFEDESDLASKKSLGQVPKFGSQRVMSASSKQVDFAKSEGAKIFNSGVGYEDVGLPKKKSREAEEKEEAHKDLENQEAAENNPGATGDIRTALANAEPPDNPVETNQIILSGVVEPNNVVAPQTAEKPPSEPGKEPEMKHQEGEETPPPH